MEQAEDVHQRALARARGTHDRDHLACLDVDVDTPERAQGVAATEVICLAQVACLEHRHGLLPYWYRIAWTGSSRAALHGGTIPAALPRIALNPTANAAVPTVRSNRIVPEARPASFATRTTVAPRARPRMPPIRPIRPASATRSRMIRRRE